MNKSEIIAFMKNAPAGYLATVEGNVPHVRALGIYKISEEEIIIQTNITKDLCKQMEKNPNVEILFHAPGKMEQVRVKGAVERINDEAALKKVMEDRPFLKDAAAHGNGPALFRMKKPLAYAWNMAANYAPKEWVPLYK